MKIKIAQKLLGQAQQESQPCAFWFISALSKISSEFPNKPIIEVLELAKEAMPIAAQQYSDYVKNT